MILRRAFGYCSQLQSKYNKGKKAAVGLFVKTVNFINLTLFTLAAREKTNKEKKKDDASSFESIIK